PDGTSRFSALPIFLEGVVAPRRHHPAYRLERLGWERRPTDLHAERRDQLGLHRVGQQGDHAAALRTAERRGERAIARELPVLERHLSVALDAQELHVIADRSEERRVGKESRVGW